MLEAPQLLEERAIDATKGCGFCCARAALGFLCAFFASNA